jgi:hypothetical protein
MNSELEDLVRERTNELMEEIRMRNIVGRRLAESEEAPKRMDTILKIMRRRYRLRYMRPPFKCKIISR